MIRLLLPLVTFVGLIGLLIIGMQTADERKIVDSPLVGRPIPNLVLPQLHQPANTTSTADRLGEVWVLNVWGSWCQSCRIEHPYVGRLAKESGVPVVGFNWKDERDDALRWLSQFGDVWAYHMVDYEGRSAIDLGVYGAPETFLIDHRGIIRHKHIGPIDETILGDLMARIQRLQQEVGA
ncbi:MAG TPA: DsbE family thiol:disulfide interchange protein [Wenzhouxiangella sp.]